MQQITEEMRQYMNSKGLNISDIYKSPVALTYLETSAHQVELLENMIEDIQNHFFIDDTPSEGLDKRLLERGLPERFQGSKASGYVIAGKNSPFIIGTVIPEDTILMTESGEVQLRVTAATPLSVGQTTTKVPVECTEVGIGGNLLPNTELTYSGVAISEVEVFKVDSNGLSGGLDAESDDDVKNRIKEDIQKTATSANKNHCVKWAKEVQGVGDAICIPLWNGPNTAKLVIVDMEKEPASSELVEKVQNYIDPQANGLGEGVAPIGLFITVAPAQQLQLDVSARLVLMDGYESSMIQQVIEAGIKDYLRTLAFKSKIIRHSHIGDVIYSTEGVLDYFDLTINGTSSNIEYDEGSVPILGVCTWTM